MALLLTILLLILLVVYSSNVTGDNSLFQYESADDLNKNWILKCSATANTNGSGVRLAQRLGNTAGSMSTNATFQATQVDFQLEIRITANPKMRQVDGYAIYIVPKSSVLSQWCCASCLNVSHYGVLKSPGNGTLGIRFYTRFMPLVGVDIFPPSSEYYPADSVTPGKTTFAWPWLHYPNSPPYSLGVCTKFNEGYYGDTTTIVKLLGGNITVEIQTMSADNTTLTTTCADNVPVPDLVSLIQGGNAVLAISGGCGASNFFNDPIVQSVHFYSLLAATPISTEITTVTEPSTTVSSNDTTTTLEHTLTSNSFDSTIIESTITLPELANSATSEVTEITQTIDSSVDLSKRPPPTKVQITSAKEASVQLETFYPHFTPTNASIPTWKVSEMLSYCYHFGPNLTAPPNNGKANEIMTVFLIDRIVDFDNVGETITASAGLPQHWKVTTCFKWKDDSRWDFREKVFLTSPNDVWVPSYLFTTSSNDIYMQTRSSYGTDLTAAVVQTERDDYKGLEFFYTRRGFFKAACTLNLATFPFDTQSCNFSFSLKESIESAFFSQVDFICSENEITEWRFTGCSYFLETTKFQGSVVDSVNFQVELVRKSWFYIFNLVLPNLVLSVLELASFLIPPHLPSRPLFGVTILLALTVAQSQALQGVPKTWQPILLADYILMLTCCAALTTLYQLYACSKSKKETNKWRFRLSKARCLDLFAFLAMVAMFAGVNIYAVVVAFF